VHGIAALRPFVRARRNDTLNQVWALGNDRKCGNEPAVPDFTLAHITRKEATAFLHDGVLLPIKLPPFQAERF